MTACSQEKADRFQAELRMRYTSETTWQREASKLRDDLMEAAGDGPENQFKDVQGDENTN